MKEILKKYICIPVSDDPYIMEEREPTKSNALKSSLWEIVGLQKHAIPSVATAARFISQPLPNQEWDLSSVLETKEDDVSGFILIEKCFTIRTHNWYNYSTTSCFSFVSRRGSYTKAKKSF